MRLGPGGRGARGSGRAGYGGVVIHERHRHRYEFNNHYRPVHGEARLVVSGTFQEGRLVEIVELPDHPWFFARQFHPEFKSRPTQARTAVPRVRGRRTPARTFAHRRPAQRRRLGGLGGTSLVAGVRCSFRGKDAGSPDSGAIGATEYAASGRAARPGDSADVSPSPPNPRPGQQTPTYKSLSRRPSCRAGAEVHRQLGAVFAAQDCQTGAGRHHAAARCNRPAAPSLTATSVTRQLEQLVAVVAEQLARVPR